MAQLSSRWGSIRKSIQGVEEMRKEFGKVIIELAEKDDKIVLVVGDIGYAIFDEYIKRFPDRFFNFGICEQSMISAASGMALEGLKPYVFTITPFLIERPFEQVKLDIDQQNVDVKLVGYADYPNQGPTHEELDGKKLMSLFKNIKSYFPNNSQETRDMLYCVSQDKSPAFISLKKNK
jgi:transketolase